jgi:hypothetical protein
MMGNQVTFSENEELNGLVKGFEDKWGLTNCGGSNYIPNIAPTASLGDYLNRKGYCSLILQGIVIIRIFSLVGREVFRTPMCLQL